MGITIRNYRFQLIPFKHSTSFGDGRSVRYLALEMCRQVSMGVCHLTLEKCILSLPSSSSEALASFLSFGCRPLLFYKIVWSIITCPRSDKDLQEQSEQCYRKEWRGIMHLLWCCMDVTQKTICISFYFLLGRMVQFGWDEVTELVSFTAARMVLCFVFLAKTGRSTQKGFSFCQHLLYSVKVFCLSSLALPSKQVGSEQRSGGNVSRRADPN